MPAQAKAKRTADLLFLEPSVRHAKKRLAHAGDDKENKTGPVKRPLLDQDCPFVEVVKVAKIVKINDESPFVIRDAPQVGPHLSIIKRGPNVGPVRVPAVAPIVPLVGLVPPCVIQKQDRPPPESRRDEPGKQPVMLLDQHHVRLPDYISFPEVPPLGDNRLVVAVRVRHGLPERPIKVPYSQDTFEQAMGMFLSSKVVHWGGRKWLDEFSPAELM